MKHFTLEERVEGLARAIRTTRLANREGRMTWGTCRKHLQSTWGTVRHLGLEPQVREVLEAGGDMPEHYGVSL